MSDSSESTSWDEAPARPEEPRDFDPATFRKIHQCDWDEVDRAFDETKRRLRHARYRCQGWELEKPNYRSQRKEGVMLGQAVADLLKVQGRAIIAASVNPAYSPEEALTDILTVHWKLLRTIAEEFEVARLDHASDGKIPLRAIRREAPRGNDPRDDRREGDAGALVGERRMSTF